MNGEPVKSEARTEDAVSPETAHPGAAAHPANYWQAWQRDARACQKVYAVVVDCDGESTVESLYDNEEAAVIERDFHNHRPRYFGRARIVPYNVMTTDLARRRFSRE